MHISTREDPRTSFHSYVLYKYMIMKKMNTSPISASPINNSLSPEMDLIPPVLSNLVSHYKEDEEASRLLNKFVQVLLKKKKEEEAKGNWLELPPDVLSLIFRKLGYIEILGTAQWVCTSWWKLSKQPHLFSSIHVEKVSLLGCRFSLYSSLKLSREVAREAIDRSCGQLVEFSIRTIANDELLHYMSEKCSSLRCIRLVFCRRVSDGGLIEMAKKLSQLEELEIIHCSSFSRDVFETFGRFCPRLKSCRLNYVSWSSSYTFSEVIVAIAQNMPELRYLDLFGNNLLTDDGLEAVLDGCLNLESLDLRQCFGLQFAGNLKERCGKIKVLKLPNDPTDGFIYERYLTHDILLYSYDN